jgi:hypothetical protein
LVAGGTFVAGAGVTGCKGIGAAPPAGAVFAGALAGAVGVAKVLSSTDLGARLRVDARARRKESPRNRPPHHQLAFVSRLPVWRVPRNELAELLTPPNEAAMPPPCPDCSNTATINTKLSMTRRTNSSVYSIGRRSI